MDVLLEYIKVALLATAQGIAEFLPISSSGHLLVLGDWFGFDAEENLTLNVVLHAGTLLAIVIFYFKKLLSILLESQRRKLIGLVIAGSVPAAVIGLGLKKMDWDTLLFSAPWVAGIGFALTATMLLLVFRKADNTDESRAVSSEQMSYRQALLIGCAQAIAIAPGISRSGSTISAGVKFGLKKADAAEFSFLLAIPAIGGAALLEGVDMVKSGALQALTGAEAGSIVLGFLLSAAVGYAALACLISLLKKGRLSWFSYYLYGAAAVTILVEVIKRF